MKCKPPFQLYFNNNNSVKTKPKIIENYKDKLNSIYSRIPVEVIRNSPELKKLVSSEPKITYDIINNNKKPIMMEMTGNLSEPKEKMISNLNSFREMLYDFNQEEDKLLENFSEVQKENNKFEKNYKKVQKDKNKFSTGTYLDHDYLINIASKYSERGIKIPKISSEKSVFSGNPLILGGSELEDFIVYNLGERKKSGVFLKKVANLVRRKEMGNYVMNEAEKEKMKLIEKNEKPKGYIDPTILIPKLKNEIIKCKKAINNIENLENFLKNKNNNNNNKFYKLLNISKSPRINKNININTNIFDNIYKANNNKIRIKKNLSFINKINNNRKRNSSVSNINNNRFSSISTGAYISQKVSSENSPRFISPQITNSNINSAMSRNKSIGSYFSPLPSPLYHNNNSNRINFPKINELFSEKRRYKFSHSEENSNNILISKNSFSINDNNDKRINRKNRRLFSVNNVGEVKKRNLISLRKNFDLNFEKKSIFSQNSSKILNNFDSIKNDYNSISKEETSKEHQHKFLNEEMKGKEGNKHKESKKNININLLDNNFYKAPKKIKFNNINYNNKENIIKEKIKRNSCLNIEPIKKKEDDNYKKTEKIFNSILGKGYKSRRNKKEINDYLKSKGYDLSKRILNNDAYINIIKMRKKMGDRNFLLEEYNIRSRDFGKPFLSDKQKKILDINDLYLQKIEENEYRFKKIILEKNIDVENEEN